MPHILTMTNDDERTTKGSCCRSRSISLVLPQLQEIYCTALYWPRLLGVSLGESHSFDLRHQSVRPADLAMLHDARSLLALHSLQPAFGNLPDDKAAFFADHVHIPCNLWQSVSLSVLLY